MSNIITRISRRAKQIRKKHKSMKWQSAIKQASRELKGKGKRKIKKVRHSKKVHRVVRRKKRLSGMPGVSGITSAGTTVSGLRSKLKSHYKTQLSNALLSRELAAKKSVKRKVSKRIRAIKANIRKIS